jgi:ribonuclease BN (tRNA processing enzyme)
MQAPALPGRLEWNFLAVNSCALLRALPRCRRCPASQRRKQGPPGRRRARASLLSVRLPVRHREPTARKPRGRSVPINQVFFGHDVRPGLIYQDANVKVTAAETTHFEFHTGAAAGKHKSYAYRFETPDRVVVFTGDTGPNDALTNLAKDADLLFAEANSVEERTQGLIKSGQWQAMTPAEQAGIRRQMTQGHLSPDDVGKMAAQARVKTVMLTHLTAKPDNDYTAWANEVRKHFSGQVLIAKSPSGTSSRIA